jgi:hypothetical protein
MASKKSGKKKNRTSANPRNYSELYKDDKSTVAKSTETDAAVTASAATEESGKTSDSVDWKHDYAYVVKDLRQLIIVSVVLFALVIGVGLLI